jgi:hypothetical protein
VTEAEAIAAIVEVGGRYEREHGLSGNPVVTVDLNNCRAVTDGWLRYFRGLPHVRHIEMCDTSVRGRGLSQLSGSVDLGFLDLKDSPVDDDGVRRLLDCRSLKWLGLTNTGVSAEPGDAGRSLDKTAFSRMESPMRFPIFQLIL